MKISLSELEKVRKYFLPALSHYRFRMKLNAPYRIHAVPHRVNLRLVFTRPCNDIELVRERRMLHGERMVAHDLERRLYLLEQAARIMYDHRCLSMHQLS